MALFKFTKGMLEGKEIDVYNHGDLSRDFTYIDDITEGVVRAANVIPTASAAHTQELFEVTNFKPMTNLNDGVKKFADWYRSTYS